MEIAAGMKELVDDIISSSHERAEELHRIKEETSSLRVEAAHMVKDFAASRNEKSRRLRQELAQSASDRNKEVGKILNDVRKMLGDFQGSRVETGAKLRKDLASGKAERETKVKETLSGARALIGNFQSSRRTMGTELRNDLGKDSDKRKTNVKGMRDSFRKAQSDVRAGIKEASDAWKGLSSPNLKRTSGGSATVKMPFEAQLDPTYTNNSAEIAEAAVKMPFETQFDLEEKLISIINQHPGGITLPEVAKELGVVTIVLGKAAKDLLEQGKVHKEEKMYFPVGK